VKENKWDETEEKPCVRIKEKFAWEIIMFGLFPKRKK